MIRITDLKNFLEIASCRTMREGAERLEMSQPALSESIKRFEQDTGEVLFYRARSGISLTPAGQEIERKARMALHALQEVSKDHKSETKRLITLGCHETIGSYFLPQLFKDFMPHSHLSFRLRHGFSRSVQLDIQQGRTDVGIVVNPIPSPDLVIRTIATDEVCVWESPETIQKNLPLFCNLGLNQTHVILKKWKTEPHSITEIENLELIARLVQKGSGYGIIPKRLVDLLAFTKLRKVAGTPTYKDQFALVYRPEFGKHSEEKRLLEKIKLIFS